MKNNIKLGQGLAWAAWLIFIASLFMPMETHSLAGPCAWPCAQPFTNYGWQNASFFVLSIIVFVLNLLQAFSFVMFDPQTLGKIMPSLLTAGLYAVIGLGQFLIVLAPFWSAKIKKTGWQRFHLGMVTLSSLTALAYGLFPDFRLGLDLLSGYYFWALSFLLTLVVSILLQGKQKREFKPEAGQLNTQQL